ncbi:MAG TPA: protein kinase [Vicinamibacteria bacterium]|nr:protein kinase [Vicinamibacteria bacterium]
MALEKLGKYKITGKIGKGAMGEVYRAHDPVLNREVAIKTISANLSADSDLRKRFHREAQAAARLNHPNIITVFDYGEEQGIIYMAMELLEGADLKDLITQKLLTTIEDKLDVMEQVADGLAFAHGREIIHRDLKPGNIHVQPNGQVKILDFGLARLGRDTDMTRTGVVMGTPNYMAPEQVKGEKADARADVFSTGAVFYELVCNKKPFDADSAHAVLFQVVHQQPRPMRDWAPDVPPILVQLVERAMHKDRGQRFANGGELRDALRLVRQAITGGRTQSATLETESTLVPAGDKPKEAFKSPAKPVTIPPTTQKPLGGPPTPVPSRPPSTPPVSGRPRPRAEMFTETRRPAPPPPPPPTPRAPSPSKTPIVLGALAIVLLAGGLAALVLLPRSQAPEPTPGASVANAQVAALSEALVGTQVELARRDLEDKNYKDAASQAERALKLAPGNAEAKAVLEQAQAQLAAIEQAAVEARTSLAGGDTKTATEALARLLALDPTHPAAAELSAGLNSFFQAQALEAKRSAADSRALADQAKAASSDTYGQAAARAREGDGLLDRSEFAAATRAFLEARDAFDRARRAAEAKPLPTPPPAVAKPAAPAPAVASRPTAPPATAPAVALPPVTAPPVTEAPKPLVPPRPFAAGRTEVQAARRSGKAPAGFDSEDVLADRDFLCKLAFEYSPAAVRPGDSYAIRVYMVNDTAKPIKVKTISLSVALNGGKDSRPTQGVKEAPARQRTLLGEFGGSWPEGVQTWAAEAVVTSSKDDSCRSRLSLK